MTGGPPEERSTEGLPSLLKRSARGASDGRLVLHIAAGLVAAAAIFAWHPRGWPVPTSAAVAAAAFGAWGILDRELGERRDRPGNAVRLLGAGRAVVEMAGWLALAACGFSVLGFALGTWIS